MPRYFFNRTDGFVERDDEGTELSGLPAARRQAVVFAGESLKDDPELAWNGDEFRVEVTDGDGLVLFTIKTECMNAEKAGGLA